MMSAQGLFAMRYPPDSRLVSIHENVCRSPPLRPDDTLVEIITICMEHPTLPNLDKTDEIIRALTHPLLIHSFDSEFAGVTWETRTVLIDTIEAKFDVLLEHLPRDKFQYREVGGKRFFVRSRREEFFERRMINELGDSIIVHGHDKNVEHLVVKVPIYLDDNIRKCFNITRTSCLRMCQEIMCCMRKIIDEQTWQLQCWECMPGRYNRDDPQWRGGNGDADIQTALALSAAEALRAPAAAVPPTARTDDHFWSDNDDLDIQAGAPAARGAPADRTDGDFGSDNDDPDIQAAIIASLEDQPAAPAAVSPAAPAVVSPAAPAAVSRTCLVCFEETDDDLLAIIPCGHRCVCNVCAPILVINRKRCPVCRGKITRCIRIFDCGRL
jgi:hypothetical protein